MVRVFSGGIDVIVVAADGHRVSGGVMIIGVDDIVEDSGRPVASATPRKLGCVWVNSHAQDMSIRQPCLGVIDWIWPRVWRQLNRLRGAAIVIPQGGVAANLVRFCGFELGVGGLIQDVLVVLHLGGIDTAKLHQ
ncbi:MAG: hypothetical protein WCR46_22860 [Deltaproteobacteria bacterium]